MSAKSFWPTWALLKTAGSGESTKITEITEITVSTFEVRGDLGNCARQVLEREGIASRGSHALGGSATLD